jgi:hypothetical protein
MEPPLYAFEEIMKWAKERHTKMEEEDNNKNLDERDSDDTDSNKYYYYKL